MSNLNKEKAIKLLDKNLSKFDTYDEKWEWYQKMYNSNYNFKKVLDDPSVRSHFNKVMFEDLMDTPSVTGYEFHPQVSNAILLKRFSEIDDLQDKIDSSFSEEDIALIEERNEKVKSIKDRRRNLVDQHRTAVKSYVENPETRSPWENPVTAFIALSTQIGAGWVDWFREEGTDKIETWGLASTNPNYPGIGYPDFIKDIETKIDQTYKDMNKIDKDPKYHEASDAIADYNKAIEEQKDSVKLVKHSKLDDALRHIDLEQLNEYVKNKTISWEE